MEQIKTHETKRERDDGERERGQVKRKQCSNAATRSHCLSEIGGHYIGKHSIGGAHTPAGLTIDGLVSNVCRMR